MIPLKSPGAFAAYRSVVEEANRNALAVRSDLDVTDADNTWWELTELEVLAFGIEPSLHNALLWAYIRYTDMTGETDIHFRAFREEERTAFPEYFHAAAQESVDAAARFMACACQLPYSQALIWMCRREVQLVRSGILMDGWDAPHWCYCDVAMPGTPDGER